VAASVESASVTFSFQLSRSEYSSLFRRGTLALGRTKVLLSSFTALMVLGLILRNTGPRALGKLLFAIDFSFLFSMVVVVLLLSPHLAWRSDRSLASMQSVTITHQAISLRTSNRTRTHDWLGVAPALEIDKGFYFAFRGPSTLILLPKRAITTDDDMRIVRSFVKQRSRIRRI
jgi:hypothetical protein